MTYGKIMYHAAWWALFAVLSPLLTLLFIGAGLVSGLIVGIVLDDTWAALMAGTGWPLEAWQTGGIMAFIGGFFKPGVNVQKAET